MSNLSDVMTQRVSQPDTIPEDWKWNKLTDVCRPKQWKTISSSEMVPSGYPVFGANGFVGFYNEYNHEFETVTITCRGNTCGTINRVPPKTYITGNSMALNEVSTESVTQDFLFYALNYRSVSDAISGSAQPQITRDSLNRIRFPHPPIPEQKKIAAILSSVDDVIEKTQAQINKLKDLKTGMMQELLSPREGTGQPQGVGENGKGHTEFKDSPIGRIPVGWDVTTLKNLVDVMESGWSPQCEPLKAGTGQWGVLKTTSVTWDGFDYTANKKLPDILDPRPSIQVNQGDILITRAGPAERVGVIAFVEEVPERIILSDKIIRISVNDKFNSRYISYWLSSNFVKNFFSVRTTGLAQSQTNISQDILKSVPCIVPTLEEQNKISSSISSTESRLKYAIMRLNQYKNVKKALMQDLLTGKVRVAVPSHSCDHGMSESIQVKD